MLKILYISICYQLRISFRIKQSVFFSLIFPIFLFVIFGNLWGMDNPEYITLIFSGVIGMTLASDGVFAIGPVIKEYYSSGLIKYLRKLPFNILLHFMGLIFNRVVVLILMIALLLLTSKLIFGSILSLEELKNLMIGSFIGLFIFSFLGLTFAFTSLRQNSGQSLINLLYFVMLFTSDTFYSVGEFNKIIGLIGDLLPLNPVLSLLRGEGIEYSLLFWTIIPPTLFYILFNRIQFKR